MALDIIWAGLGAWGFGFVMLAFDTDDGVAGGVNELRHIIYLCRLLIDQFLLR